MAKIRRENETMVLPVSKVKLLTNAFIGILSQLKIQDNEKVVNDKDDLNVSESNVLNFLKKSVDTCGQITLDDLSKSLSMDKRISGRIISCLQKKNYVARSPSGVITLL